MRTTTSDVATLKPPRERDGTFVDLLMTPHGSLVPRETCTATSVCQSSLLHVSGPGFEDCYINSLPWRGAWAGVDRTNARRMAS